MKRRGPLSPHGPQDESRVSRREDIFADDFDRERFLETLAETCQKTGWHVLAYCLMSNHFHLVIETPQPNLVAGMKWLRGTYSSRVSRRHNEFGHLFRGRYKALIVDGSGDGYLRTVCDYVHLNPIRARLLRPKQPLEAYRWSSYAEYLKSSKKRCAWLRVKRLFGEMRIPKDSPAGRRQFGRWMEERRRQKTDESEWKPLRRGWYLGEKAFKK